MRSLVVDASQMLAGHTFPLPIDATLLNVDDVEPSATPGAPASTSGIPQPVLSMPSAWRNLPLTAHGTKFGRAKGRDRDPRLQRQPLRPGGITQCGPLTRPESGTGTVASLGRGLGMISVVTVVAPTVCGVLMRPVSLRA